MIQVLIPLGGKSPFFPEGEYIYPKPLIEIDGRPMIQHVVENLTSLDADVKFTFVVNKEDCQKHHLDSVLQLVTEEISQVIRLDGPTQGAACSCLMAIEKVSEEEELVIANADQILDLDLGLVIKYFRQKGADAGMITFDAVHPRWSFARIEDGLVVETGEKTPISRNAIAGFYYFSKAGLFFDAARQSIKRGGAVDGKFFIAPVFNELVLQGKRLYSYTMENQKFHTFYTPQKIAEYEGSLVRRKQE